MLGAFLPISSDGWINIIRYSRVFVGCTIKDIGVNVCHLVVVNIINNDYFAHIDSYVSQKCKE